MRLDLGIGLNFSSNSFIESINILTQRFVSRVESDLGVVESEGCINNADFINNNWSYYYRVIDDSGVVESLECVNNI